MQLANRLLARKQRGDTIIEVMIALAVLSMTFSLSYATATHSILVARNTQEHSEVLQYLQSQVELLRAYASDTALFAPGTYCMDSNPADTATYGKPVAYVSGSATSPCVISMDNGAYDLTVTYQYQKLVQNSVSQDVYTFTAAWPGLGTLGPQREQFVYKFHKSSAPGDLTVSGSAYTPPPPPPPPLVHGNQTFTTSGSHSFIVPAGVTSITIDARGAAGGYGQGYWSPGSVPGNGARVQATLSVTPGEALYAYVGGLATGYNGGFNGGGNGSPGGYPSMPGNLGGGGGGASDIRSSGGTLSDRLIVAGGGAGAGGDCYGGGSNGGGGGSVGADGTDCYSYIVGEGATQTSGGAPEYYYSGWGVGTAGTLGQGGNGGYNTIGGGGGGGWYGGGGGQFGGGGGGSSYATPTAASVSITPGYNNGSGWIMISW